MLSHSTSVFHSPLPSRLYLPVMPNTTPIVFGVVLATKFWLYFTAMVYLLPAGILVHYWWLHEATFFSLALLQGIHE